MRPKVLGLVFLCLLLVSMVTIAVEQTGEITGQVRDDRKQPLPGVTVTLSGASLQGDRAVISGANGGFVFRVLPPGVYSVERHRQTWTSPPGS